MSLHNGPFQSAPSCDSTTFSHEFSVAEIPYISRHAFLRRYARPLVNSSAVMSVQHPSNAFVASSYRNPYTGHSTNTSYYNFTSTNSYVNRVTRPETMAAAENSSHYIEPRCGVQPVPFDGTFNSLQQSWYPPVVPQLYHPRTATDRSNASILIEYSPLLRGTVVQECDEAPCYWGNSPCPVPITKNKSPSAINRHLKEFHFSDDTRPWEEKGRGPCEWRGADGQCCRVMNYAIFGKHIASCHLRSTATICPLCFHEMGRADSLQRHMKLYCTPISGYD